MLNRPNAGWQAVADLGTNTFQLLVARWKDGAMDTGLRLKNGVQIGKHGMREKRITPEAVTRAIAALTHFAKELAAFGLSPEQCTVLATSAFRNATNAGEIVKTIFAETGFRVEVISGEQEADLIFNGVAASGAIPGKGYSLVVDIGGGSVECILCNHRAAVWRKSIEVGGLRLMEKFHHHDPIATEEITNLETYLEEKLQPLFDAATIYTPTTLVGCSGSFDTLIEMVARHHQWHLHDVETQPAYCLDMVHFQTLSNEIIAATLAQRLAMPGMIALRAEMMVVAVILIRFLLKRLHIAGIQVSTWSLKEGALISAR